MKVWGPFSLSLTDLHTKWGEYYQKCFYWGKTICTFTCVSESIIMVMVAARNVTLIIYIRQNAFKKTQNAIVFSGRHNCWDIKIFGKQSLVNPNCYCFCRSSPPFSHRFAHKIREMTPKMFLKRLRVRKWHFFHLLMMLRKPYVL